MGLQSVSSSVGIGLNFLHIFHVDIIVVSCSIRRTDYNGRRKSWSLNDFSVEIELQSVSS